MPLAYADPAYLEPNQKVPRGCDEQYVQVPNAQNWPRSIVAI